MCHKSFEESEPSHDASINDSKVESSRLSEQEKISGTGPMGGMSGGLTIQDSYQGLLDFLLKFIYSEKATKI